jgi:hypothetical protein
MSALEVQQPRNVEAKGIIDQIVFRLMQSGSKISKHGEDLEGCPVTHHFTPGLYCRQIFMPARSVVVSRIHKTEHPFVVSQGHCCVYNERGEWLELRAPHFGITTPGTRRFLVMLADTVWTTFHPTQLTNVREIEAHILEPIDSQLLTEVTT